jgi:hypothetical protein
MSSKKGDGRIPENTGAEFGKIRNPGFVGRSSTLRCFVRYLWDGSSHFLAVYLVMLRRGISLGVISVCRHRVILCFILCSQ